MKSEDMVGRFEGNTIIVDLEIISPIASDVKKVLSVTLDTGASNDLCLTYKEAFPLALTLVGVEDYTIADGSHGGYPFLRTPFLNFGHARLLVSMIVA